MTALFTVNGSSAQQAHVVAYSSTVALALVDTAGAGSIAWSVVSSSNPEEAVPAITVTGIGTAEFTMPASTDALGRSYIVEALVNGGLEDGRLVPALRVRRLIGAVSTAGLVPPCPGETFERDAVAGWQVLMRSLVAAAAAGPTAPDDPGDDGKAWVADSGAASWQLVIPAPSAGQRLLRSNGAGLGAWAWQVPAANWFPVSESAAIARSVQLNATSYTTDDTPLDIEVLQWQASDLAHYRIAAAVAARHSTQRARFERSWWVEQGGSGVTVHDPAIAGDEANGITGAPSIDLVVADIGGGIRSARLRLTGVAATNIGWRYRADYGYHPLAGDTA